MSGQGPDAQTIDAGRGACRAWRGRVARALVHGWLAWAATAATGGLAEARGQTPAPCRTDETVYVGTDGTGLRALRFDACAGQLAAAGLVADVPKPRWVLAHPNLPLVYVAVDGSGAEGRVAAYRRDAATPGLTLVGEVGAGGAGTTHLALDAASRTLLAANFGGGSVSSLSLQADGAPGQRVTTLAATGSGPHRRQASAHAHAAAFDPSGRWVLVPDLGADRVFVYGFDPATQRLLPDDAAAPRAHVAPPGSGPRRAVFSRDGRFVYGVHELTAELITLRWDAAQGRLTPLHTLPLSSPGFQGARSASEIALGADGRFLYVADRGEGTVLVFRVEPDGGRPELVQRLSSGGDAPWAFDVHASGRWLLVANQRSQRLQLFAIDPATGRLSDTGQGVDSPGPVSVTFMN